MGKHNLKIIILIIVLLLLLTAIGLLITGYIQVEDQLFAKEVEAMKLQKDMEELDKYLTDYIVVGVEEEANDPRSIQREAEAIREAYARIDQLERRLAKLKKDKETSDQEIQILQKQLSTLKLRLYERNKASMGSFVTELQRLVLYIDTLESISLMPKDVGSAGLDSAYISEVQRLKRKIAQLNEDLKLITELKAINFEFVNVKKGFDVKRRHFNKGTIDKFKICFDIPGNPFPDYSAGPKDLYLLFFNPDNTPSFNTKKFSGRSKGRNPFMYSATQQFIRGRTAQNICIEYAPEHNDFMPGLQKVQIRCDGEIIGEQVFEISE